MEKNKVYWKGIEELTNDLEYVKHADKEFPEYLPINSNKETSDEVGVGTNRRDFLKLMGFGIGAATLAACQTPVKKAIPYVVKPSDVDPGVPNYYASTYQVGGDYAAVLVKTREGRPIKVEGNSLSSITQGKVNAQVDASILSLYDSQRFKAPQANGQAVSWSDLDNEVTAKLDSIAASGGNIRIVSNTVLSPSALASIDAFKAKYPTTEHVVYDAASASGMLAANEQSFGARFIPSYDFSKAEVIVSFGADFLGTWVSPIEFTKQYAATRKLGPNKKVMSRHYQFESNMSLAGANADYRERIKPSQQGAFVAQLYNLIAGNNAVQGPKVVNPVLDKAAKDLMAARGKALVVSGSNDPDVQLLVNGINNLLGNYGSTIDTAKTVNFRQGDDAAMAQFVSDVKGGNVGAAIFFGANPVYDYPMGNDLGEALSKVELTVSTSSLPNETTEAVGYVAPDHHYLESWGDANPKVGEYSLAQPTISPIFDTRQALESFLVWSGDKTSSYDFVKNYWQTNLFPASDGLIFEAWFDKMLHDGVFTTSDAGASVSFAGDVASIGGRINQNYAEGNSGFELALYQKVGIGTGVQANNPWLHEMPDPITKAVWDNYVTVSQADADEIGLKYHEGKTNKVNLTVGGQTISGIPALVQPGQAQGTLGLAVGYGRRKGGPVAEGPIERVGGQWGPTPTDRQGLGKDAFPLMTMLNGTCSWDVTSGVSIEVTSEQYHIAQTQTHQTYMKRENVVQETVLSEYQHNALAGKPEVKITTAAGEKKEPYAISLWGLHEYKNHHWGMAIDMNSCTGCSACHIACQTENNIPVVGRKEVINRREMHWIRIDRYYSSDADADPGKGISVQRAREIASENPQVTFQPMMCQQCNNAPCETVCPVAATTHSTEGLNQMTYNRCIGTRYCANNCPYKVRRFNWFKYHDNKQFQDVNYASNDDLGKMVLNPDVTVRSRGVMEKCSFCVQRIQLGKLEAKKQGRRPQDGEIVSACASACPADAITFGDMKDPDSKISQLLRIQNSEDPQIAKEVAEERAYHMLDELRVHPNVFYLRKVRNIDETSHA